MADWNVAAGHKADAHRIRDLYRKEFGSSAKSVARDRVIEAMRAAGVTTVLDLWGGGVSAKAFVEAGFRVISVDDGSMELRVSGKDVVHARKRRALEYAAAEDGYEWRFGKRVVEKTAAEADGAYLDFCGPWSASTRRAVEACRHMKAVAVTLTPDHDMSTDASSAIERQMAYQLFLKMAWAKSERWAMLKGAGNVRRLIDYRRDRGFWVFVYLLSPTWIKLSPLRRSDRVKTKPSMAEKDRIDGRNWYHRNRDRLLPLKRREERAKQCAICGIGFMTKTARKYCGERCARVAHSEQNRRRLSGVSGTPDEAI